MTGSFRADDPGLPPGALGEWQVGVNVPWSVSWTGEQDYELHLSEDFPGLVDLVQGQNPGAGLPKFAALHVTRHRLGMAGHLCHVCGRKTLKGDRYIFPVESGGFVIMPDESTRYAGNVPPVHLACARRARSLCPHLSRAFAEPVAYPAEPSQLMQRTDVVPGMEGLAKTLPGNLKIVFTCYRLFGPKFSRKVAEMRAAKA